MLKTLKFKTVKTVIFPCPLKSMVEPSKYARIFVNFSNIHDYRISIFEFELNFC